MQPFTAYACVVNPVSILQRVTDPEMTGSVELTLMSPDLRTGLTPVRGRFGEASIKPENWV